MLGRMAARSINPVKLNIYFSRRPKDVFARLRLSSATDHMRKEYSTPKTATENHSKATSCQPYSAAILSTDSRHTAIRLSTIKTERKRSHTLLTGSSFLAELTTSITRWRKTNIFFSLLIFMLFFYAIFCYIELESFFCIDLFLKLKQCLPSADSTSREGSRFDRKPIASHP